MSQILSVLSPEFALIQVVLYNLWSDILWIMRSLKSNSSLCLSIDHNLSHVMYCVCVVINNDIHADKCTYTHCMFMLYMNIWFIRTFRLNEQNLSTSYDLKY